MSNPYSPRRDVFNADELLDKLSGSDELLDVDKVLAKIAPALSTANFQPKDENLQDFWSIYQTREGRRLFEWLFDLTLRCPYPHVGKDFQEAALSAAKHQARAGIGEVLLEALALGKKLSDENRSL